MTSRLEHVHVNDERSDLVINITNPELLLMDSPIGRNLIVHPAIAFFLGVISAFFKLLLFSFSSKDPVNNYFRVSWNSFAYGRHQVDETFSSN